MSVAVTVQVDGGAVRPARVVGTLDDLAASDSGINIELAMSNCTDADNRNRTCYLMGCIA